jgi:predicted RND superfamily exporter protein
MQVRSWVALALLALLAGLLARDASDWQPDNRIGSWVQRGEARARHELLTQEFGGDEFALVRVEGLALDGDDLEWLEDLAQDLAEQQAVSRVLQPMDLPGAKPGSLRERLEASAARPLAHALDLVDLGDPTSVRCDLLVAIRPAALPAARDELAAFCTAAGVRAAERGLLLRAAGHPLVASALDAESRTVDQTFAPLLVLLAGLVLTLFYRSLPVALAAVLPAAIASAGARSALKHLGLPSNLILVTLGPVLFVVVLAATLHLVSAFRRERVRGLEPAEAAARAWGRLHRATLLAALTSSLGFGVFVTSSVEAVSDLGIAVAISIAVATPLALLACRFVLGGIAHAPTPRRGRASGTWFRKLALRSWRRRWWLRGLGASVLLLSVLGSQRLQFSTNALDYFPSHHPVRDAFVSLEEDGAALSTIELIVQQPPSTRADGLDALLLTLDGVRGVFGPEVVERDLQSVLGRLGARLALGVALREGGRVSRSGDSTRWTIFTSSGDSDGIAALAAEIESAARRWAGGDSQVYACGSLLGTLEMQVALTSTLAASLGLALLVTTILFLLVVRSVAELGAALVVNLFPVGAVMLANAASFAQLDPATVMVTAVVLGLAVDNTFHLLHAAGAHGRSRTRRDRLRAFQAVGEPALTSTLALALGFGALAFSEFVPTARFGTLVGIGVLTAAFSDFVLLPALWLGEPGTKR